MEKSGAGGEGEMEISCQMKGLNFDELESRTDSPFAWNSVTHRLACVLLAVWFGGTAMAQSGPLVLERNGWAISLEPYAANIVRVTMSIDKAAATGAPGYGFVAKAVGRRMDARARRGGRRRFPIRPDGGASGDQQTFLPRTAAAANAAGRAEPSAARTLLWRWERAWAAERRAPGDNSRGARCCCRCDTWMMAAGTRGRRSAGRRSEGLLGCGRVRLARRRALLRTGATAEGLDGPAGSRDPLLARLLGDWWRGRLRTVHGVQPRLRTGVGQPFQNDSDSRVQWTEYVVLGSRRPCFVLRHCRGNQRRNLRGLPSADRRDAHAAEAQRTDTSRARRSIQRRNRFWMWPRSIARRSCRWMSWSWTSST